MALKGTVGKVVGVCVSKPKLVRDFDGELVSSAIFKESVFGRIKLSKLNLDGDEQADLTVHGGIDKALYLYPLEHYSWWQGQMPDVEFINGKFGENLTTTGIIESEVFIGDKFQVGTAVVKVSQPRLPCYKLGIKFGRTDVIKKFMMSGFSGIYFSVVKEGLLGVGDEIRYLEGDGCGITVSDVANLFNGNLSRDKEFIDRCLNSQLAEQMKRFISRP
ncbi:MAG: MOSC domain-containing protein [Cyanobacteria bacterium TGS_CYA1]|nr:MOSC domain-containing protein [Cyanobacteria bacterium TGS_CYA1]